jgi:hydrogenase maturation protease
MDRTLIIGIGNELRGDDAAGVVAARRLAERNPAAHLKIVHQLTAEMALGLGDYSTVLFLDADVEASEPTCRPVEPAFDRMTVDPHRMTAAQLLVIARALDEPLPRYAFEVGLPACRPRPVDGQRTSLRSPPLLAILKRPCRSGLVYCF